jgi:hypothetical protein
MGCCWAELETNAESEIWWFCYCIAEEGTMLVVGEMWLQGLVQECHQMSYIETESSPDLLRWIVQHMATTVLDYVGSDLAKGQIWLSEKGMKSPNDWWTSHLETRQHKDSEMVLWKEWKIWSVHLTRSKSDLPTEVGTGRRENLV